MDLEANLTSQSEAPDMQDYIPERFMRRIDAHLLGNYSHIDNYPLILCIVGEPGTGKTWQLRRYLKHLGVETFSVDSSLLEDEFAGRPAKYLKGTYIKASVSCKEKSRSAIVIDDFDTTLGEWKQNTGTVNHQALLSFLMHIAEDPSSVDSATGLSTVPIFITANHIERIYRPLMRYGRSDVFKWKPTPEERANIIASILKIPDNSRKTAVELAKRYESEPISFFSHLIATARINAILDARNDWNTKDLIFSEKALLKLNELCNSQLDTIDWVTFADLTIANKTTEVDGRGR